MVAIRSIGIGVGIGVGIGAAPTVLNCLGDTASLWRHGFPCDEDSVEKDLADFNIDEKDLVAI